MDDGECAWVFHSFGDVLDTGSTCPCWAPRVIFTCTFVCYCMIAHVAHQLCLCSKKYGCDACNFKWKITLLSFTGCFVLIMIGGFVFVVVMFVADMRHINESEDASETSKAVGLLIG